MPQKVLTLPISDWGGGLNLNADAFQLRDNESPDLLNVDIDPRGGFYLRDTITAINTTVLASTPANVWTFSSSDSTVKHLLVQQGNDAAYSTGGNFTAINPDALATTGKMRGVTFKDKCYIQRNREQVAWEWDGTTATAMTDVHGTYNDDFAAPANNNEMPIARYIATWQNFLFHANTVESGTAKRSRVRFSHPNQPEDYRTNDWFDVSPDDGDEITALVPWKDRLLVFKNNSIHAVFGYDHNTFQQVLVSSTVGAIGQEAIAVAEDGVYFFSWPEGVFRYNGKQVEDVFYPLRPLVDDNTIPAAYQSTITLGWLRQRLWVAVPYASSTTPTRVLVFDPATSKYGGWTMYDMALGPMLEWQPPGSAATYIGCAAATGRVYKLHQTGVSDLLDGAASTTVTGYLRTRWYDLGNAALVKRWKRPRLVLDDDYSATLRLDVFKDYDSHVLSRTSTLGITADSTGTLWNGSTWNGGVWTDGTLGSQAIDKGPLIGRATAVQLKLSSATTATKWGVNSLVLTYVPKRVR